MVFLSNKSTMFSQQIVGLLNGFEPCWVNQTEPTTCGCVWNLGFSAGGAAAASSSSLYGLGVLCSCAGGLSSLERRWSPWWKSQIGPERAILTILVFRPWLDFNFFLKTHCLMLYPVVLVLVKGFRFWCHPWVSFGESRGTLLDFGKFTLRFPRLGRQNAETHLLYASA